MTLRRSIGYGFGFLATIVLIVILDKIEKCKSQNKALKHENTVLRRLDKLNHLSVAAKQTELSSLDRELRELMARSYLTEQEKDRIRVLEDIKSKSPQ